MRKITVRQIDIKASCKHIQLHTFLFPDVRDNGFYRLAISYSAFFESGKRRNQSARHLFLPIDHFDVNFQNNYERERDAALPVMEHLSLLDFLKNIGYDRRSKKFLLNS